nr:DUF4406 domain-containing protein [Variovorax boronicumulans]
MSGRPWTADEARQLAQTASSLVRRWEDGVPGHDLAEWSDQAATTLRALAMQRLEAGCGQVLLPAARSGRVYLSGPMTGHPEFNFPAFNAAAAALRARGTVVVNPAEHGLVDGATWADYVRADIAQLAVCESIALLPGWSASRGAALEVHNALALGMSVTYLEGAERPTAGAADPSAGLPAHTPGDLDG